MIRALKNLFNAKLENDESNGGDVLAIAAGVLMLEIARADDDIDNDEEAVVYASLKKILDSSDSEVAEIYKLVAKEVESSISLYEFTSLINENFSKERKYSLLVTLWKIAYADGRIDKYEEYYIRKIKDLLYLSQSKFIKAKHEACPSV